MVVRKKTTTKKRIVRKTASKRARSTGRCARDKMVRKAPVRRRATASKRVAGGTKKKIGVIIHFFDGIGVAVIKLSGTIKLGDQLSIEGATTNLKQKVASMQIEHKTVTQAKKGQSVGMKVKGKVKEKDMVYKL